MHDVNPVNLDGSLIGMEKKDEINKESVKVTCQVDAQNSSSVM